MRLELKHTGRRTGGTLRTLRRASALTLLSLLLPPIPVFAGELSEYQVKAGFVLNIVRFTEWPAADLAKVPEIRVCTIGSDPFRQAFDALNGKSAKGKPISVSHLDQLESVQGCHALFIGESQRKQIPRTLKYLRQAPVLTVSEVEEFPEAGGMVNLLVERNKTVLEVNNGAIRKANLKISAQVLKVARRVIE